MSSANMIAIVSFCLLSVHCNVERGQNTKNPRDINNTVDIPIGARALLSAYPNFVKGYKNDSLLLADGTQIVYDDGREKSFEQILDDADPEDMFAFTYERTDKEPRYLQDAGRSRCEALFKMMYGNSESAVRQKLIQVEWFGEQVLFTSINGAADSLRAVAVDITAHPKFTKLQPYLKSGGSFYWRKVRGANRQSAHSYGMTIDIGVNHSNYWLWKNPGKKESDEIVYANRMPAELVDIFEQHGFIWGGRWYHYDTMHFEFRPEILIFESLKANIILT